MVTLASVRPEDLVPGFGETAAGINRLAQDVKLGRAQSQFFDPESTKQQKMEAFGRISSLNPQFGQVLLQSMEQQDIQKQRQIQQGIRTNLNRMALINKQPTFEKKQAAIKREIEKAIVADEDPAQLLELFDMDEAALKQEIQTAEIIATDVDKLFERPEDALAGQLGKVDQSKVTTKSFKAFVESGGDRTLLRPRAEPASPIGRLQEDRRNAALNFGEGSQQVKEIDAQISGLTAKDQRTPLTKAGKQIADRAFIAENSPGDLTVFDELTSLEKKKEEGAKISDVASLRGQFLKQSSEFITIKSALQKVLSAPNDPSGDLAKVFGIMKILDPGSTVREGEQATARDAAGVGERMFNIYNQVVKGDSLTPEQRKRFDNLAQLTFDSQIPDQRKRQEFFTGIATRQGMDARNVVRDLLETTQAPPAPAQTGPTTALQDLKAFQSGRFKVTVEN